MARRRPCPVRCSRSPLISARRCRDERTPYRPHSLVRYPLGPGGPLLVTTETPAPGPARTPAEPGTTPNLLDAGDILPDTARVAWADHLAIGGCDVVALAAQYG